MVGSNTVETVIVLLIPDLLGKKSYFSTIHGVLVSGTHHFDGRHGFSVLSSLACNTHTLRYDTAAVFNLTYYITYAFLFS